MKFRTEIDIKPWQEPLEYSDRILCLGSCFATNIAQRLSERKFSVTSSPTGILFNPASIALAMRLMVYGYGPKPEEFVEVDQRFVDFRFHSSIGGATPTEATEAITKAIALGSEALASADISIITLGTAWVYRLSATNEVVANCHKQPASLFRRELLSIEECVAHLEEIVALSPKRILFTLSPVRHIGEGLEDNSLSKAILRVAIAEICRRYPTRTIYFPSFEILIDDLRDYRFYAEDMVHPSSQAVEYIMELFCEVALSKSAQQTMAKVKAIMQAINHRPTNPQSEGYRAHCLRQLEAMAQIPQVDFTIERERIEEILKNFYTFAG